MNLILKCVTSTKSSGYILWTLYMRGFMLYFCCFINYLFIQELHCLCWCSILEFSCQYCFLYGLGLILEGHLLPAVDFVFHHNDCFFDIVLLSTVSLSSCFNDYIFTSITKFWLVEKDMHLEWINEGLSVAGSYH